MKHYKYLFQLFALVTVLWFSSFGCATRAVWEDKRVSHPYNETILAFYTNAQTDNIAFIGQKFHYIFDTHTKGLIALLQKKEFLHLQQENLQINASVDMPSISDIDTHITVLFEIDRLTHEQKSWLLAHHYHESFMPPHPNIRIEVKVYTRDYLIKGKRYQINSQVNAHVVKLKRAIPLKIMEYKNEKGNLVKKIAMTPLSVTVDAVGGAIILAGAVVMIPIAIIGSIFN